ncbi:methionine ABC transporter substrate-binding protein [Allobacillus sp. SKP2-8]|uniref:MetQ/NlpA family ABC transporter substrate-binding protein n=1 Tax=unclassified Allobacillus TaxID=2628859 RepID=UPI001182FA16|nr:MetQ/NlpA family ABC transporter substrate-binding protein [Allobacillus sp. SKP2-8]TSJ65906.1 methionine ABC transporter substrate-binding protein [Allobacillus sp. SKP2-8]
MKKLLLVLLGITLIVTLAACGSSDEESNGDSNGEDTTEIVVGATSVPHAEVLEEAKPLLEEKGIDLTIETYQEYVLPNEDLDNGTLDANYFQHIPYFESQQEDIGYDFVNIGGIHIEPLGIYSKNIESIDNVEEGTVVLLSRSVADHGRVLTLLEQNDLIKIDENVNKDAATVEDVVENPLNLEFDASIEPAMLPEFYEREEDALVAINTNYAIQAGLEPREDSLIIEESDSPYVNIIAARAEDENNEALQTLVEVLRSEEITNFIEEKYEGAVVPVK